MSPTPSRETLDAWLWDLYCGKPRPEDIVAGPLEREEWFDDGEIPVEINTTQRFEWKSPPGPGRPILELVEEMRAAGCEIPKPNLRLCSQRCSKCQAVAKKKPSSEEWTCRKCGTKLNHKQKNIERFYYFACATAIASYNTPFDGELGPRGVRVSMYAPPRAPEENIPEHELQRHADLKRGEKIFQTVVEDYSQWSESVSSPFGNKKPLLEPDSFALRMDWAVRDLRKAYAEACAGGDIQNKVAITRAVALAVNAGLIGKELAVYADLELAQETRGRNAEKARKKAENSKPATQQCENFVRTAWEDFQIETRSKDRAVFREYYLPTRVDDLKKSDPALATRIENLTPRGIRTILGPLRPGKNRS